jgi:hypothetical protein
MEVIIVILNMGTGIFNKKIYELFRYNEHLERLDAEVIFVPDHNSGKEILKNPSSRFTTMVFFYPIINVIDRTNRIRQVCKLTKALGLQLRKVNFIYSKLTKKITSGHCISLIFFKIFLINMLHLFHSEWLIIIAVLP